MTKEVSNTQEQPRGSGWNSKGNKWTDLGSGAYHYSNYDGGANNSFYYKHQDGSSYYGKVVEGKHVSGVYTSPKGVRKTYGPYSRQK
ncbi:unnamed protein product [Vitrella brassicaformis CCMP3155]|uniref:Uncharacterized protein n=1 Tax=Vitrella brassicaformis (strain CCMP3155) TaxID=1169540 RepID=A0A0G4F1V3_VITBC|nr:unnamed protein product [Vitrella brassicaformis CCMP3155]|mmetsp:Transcript_2392/g.5405  ORF Transcript_2392/g.5405 Transcript_2392/m.5405 type:complete len:87 (-) Transcript_2392:242-502(-)|eukprot:CEM05508.1 unnamed protein product [Vitrella brassicaformis CCMP3155]